MLYFHTVRNSHISCGTGYGKVILLVMLPIPWPKATALTKRKRGGSHRHATGIRTQTSAAHVSMTVVMSDAANKFGNEKECNYFQHETQHDDIKDFRS